MVNQMKITQKDRILEVLRKHQYHWVSGRYFIKEMGITQTHARMFEMNKQGIVIETSKFTDEWGFKSYKLLSEPPPKKTDCCYSMERFGTHTPDCPIFQDMERIAKILEDHHQTELKLISK